ncbi:MAG: hypothetical protein OXP69_23700 [Spirochaetaceae bacterium]|nr:hypothetical protein [Spirochaetaceae bacterium]
MSPLSPVRAFRLLLDPKRPGAHNMAVDEALLRCMTPDGAPVLRLYGFAPACVSLGRFQAAGDVGDDAARVSDGVDLVRRPTGGRAVLHDDEVTYAVVLGRHHLQPFTKRAAYRASAALLLRLLGALGVRGAVHTGDSAAPAADADPDCYRATGEYEITAGAKKLVGSAQITTRDAALQHGSIPLSTSYARIARYLRGRGSAHEEGAVPGATSVAAESGRRWGYHDALHELAAAAHAELDAEPSTPSEAEVRLARELEENRYSRRHWTCAR